MLNNNFFVKNDGLNFELTLKKNKSALYGSLLWAKDSHARKVHSQHIYLPQQPALTDPV
jgi:hypothetical protein